MIKNRISLVIIILVTILFLSCTDKNIKPDDNMPLKIEILPQNLDILRETPQGIERLVYFNLSATNQLSLKGISLQVTKDSYTTNRKLIEPSGINKTMMNTVWLPADMVSGISFAILDDKGTKVLEKQITLTPASKELKIPLSKIIKKEELKRLMLRGTNYYPRYNYWDYMWTRQTRDDFESEFNEMDQLNINTIRTFYIAQSETHFNGVTFKPELIAKINDLLEVADKHRLKVMLCLGALNYSDFSNINDTKRYLQTGIEPFLYDGRVLMWDLINEPGGSSGPQATPDLSNWMVEMYAFTKQLDTLHLNTVGLTWQFDQLHALGIKPPVEQYHQYSGSVGVPTYPGERNVRDDLVSYNVACNGRPLIIGEFGTGTADPESYQEDIYRWVIEGAEAAVQRRVNLVGMYNWCAFHFPDLADPKEKNFGLIKEDGTLKPAGNLLKDTYAKWKLSTPAPWE